IGANSYDIGHVFTTGSGGVAYLGVVCDPSSKGRGTTGMGNPIADAFYIDYVAHEMGHQFGGNHPFNGSISNCSGGNRNGPTAYEPGSGSTIMGYAGICGADDLQPHSDPFFHAISLQEITNYTNTGGSCSVNTTNSNLAPVINTAGLPTGLTIPARTPFVLSATATDADGADVVMYDWEEWDLGPQAPLTAGDNGSSPIFRSFAPTTSGARMFPKLSTVLSGVAVKGELLPTTTRTLKFRLTARDVRPGYGTSQSADVSLSVVNTAGPFKVSAPNTAVSWAQGSAQTVSWDVANTSAAPVNCSAVDIALSSDGGQTFAYTLASGVANSGNASVTVPSITTTQARVSVSCANNVFFDVSDVNFTIPAGSGTYTVGGTISGLAGSGLVLTLNGATSLPLSANGSFTFPTALVTGNTYAIAVGAQPSAPAQTCTVSNGSGTIASTNVTDVAVSCITPPPVPYSVGGSVSGLTGSGLALSLNGGASLPIGGNGSFTFPTQVFSGNPYSVVVATQPSNPAQTCTVANGSGTISGDVSNVIVTCGALQTYSVGGTVSGLSGAGLSLNLNGGADLAIAANGVFAFPTSLVSGDTYAVTVGTQPEAPTQICTIANGSGTIGTANVTNLSVTCITPPTFSTVGGTVSGLVGSGLKLKLNSGANLAINADGPFAFTTQLSSGTSYTVVVIAQPSAPSQLCSVSNGSGTIGSTDVTDVEVSCVVVVTDRIFADGFEGSGG
ncbi:MAG: zinc-dependent metalloprotease family protein, partial [Dokdonella sp.]